MQQLGVTVLLDHVGAQDAERLKGVAVVMFSTITQRPRPSRSRHNAGWTPGSEWTINLISGTLLVLLRMISQWSG